MRRNSKARRGAVLVMALVALTLLTIIGAALVRLAVMETKSIDVRLRGCQARRLAEAGVARAAARLASDPDYRGETWSLSRADWPAGLAAQVTIEIGETDKPGWRRITATADYPSDAAVRARERQTADFPATHSGEKQ